MKARRLMYLHGFASGPGSRKAQIFRERLRERGLDLEIPDLAAGDFERLTISGQLEVVERTAHGEPVTLMGSSLGGYLAALYAARHPEVERLVLMAPAFEFPKRFLDQLGPELADGWRRAGWLPIFNYAAAGQSRLSWKFIEDALEYEPFPETTQPVLIFHGLHDTVVPCALSQEFASRRPGRRLELVDSDHELLNAVNRIWSEAAVFLGLALEQG